jgi:transposase
LKHVWIKFAHSEINSVFILATNNLNNSDTDEANILSNYKEQQGVERGFRFIKDPLFHLSGFFLKKPKRIDGLMMVMAL